METVKFPLSRIVADGLSINPLRRMSFQETRNQIELKLRDLVERRVSYYNFSSKKKRI
jgi:hypothetical protein